MRAQTRERAWEAVRRGRTQGPLEEPHCEQLSGGTVGTSVLPVTSGGLWARGSPQRRCVPGVLITSSDLPLENVPFLFSAPGSLSQMQLPLAPSPPQQEPCDGGAPRSLRCPSRCVIAGITKQERSPSSAGSSWAKRSQSWGVLPDTETSGEQGRAG